MGCCESMSLMIATPFYNMAGFSPYITSLLDTIVNIQKHLPNLKWQFVPLSGDSYVDRARDTIAHRFLRSDHTHLMFIDSDMAWDFCSFMRIIVADAEIVGAAYPCKNSWQNYGVLIETNGDDTPRMDGELICASAVPTGFCMIRKIVFEQIAYIAERRPQLCNKYMLRDPELDDTVLVNAFFQRIIEDGRSYGEDVSFCKRAARADRTIRIRVEPRCTIHHYGMTHYSLNYHDWLTCQPKPGDVVKLDPVYFASGSSIDDKIIYLQNLKAEEAKSERLHLETQDK